MANPFEEFNTTFTKKDVTEIINNQINKITDPKFQSIPRKDLIIFEK